MNKVLLQKTASLIRQDVVVMLGEAGSGHSAGSLGMADIFVSLYFQLLHHKSLNPWWNDRDRLLVSNGHICPVWYATLARAGYFEKNKIYTLRQIDSNLQGHPQFRSVPGVENTSGPLGQGVSLSIGVALAAKLKRQTWKTICITSDGEQQEGQVWEAYMAAKKFSLDNLIFIMDRNHIQIGGDTENIMPLESLREKLKAFGLFVLEIDGHDFEQIEDAYYKAMTIKKQATMIIAHTIPGKGVRFMEGDYKWHGKTPNKEETEKALRELDNNKVLF